MHVFGAPRLALFFVSVSAWIAVSVSVRGQPSSFAPLPDAPGSVRAKIATSGSAFLPTGLEAVTAEDKAYAAWHGADAEEDREIADSDRNNNNLMPQSGAGAVNLLPLLSEARKIMRSPPMEEANEHYHWSGLLWETFEFFGVENSFRLMTDPYFRYLTADKPFWHDYIASARQWNMGRWSDGDDFLVAYIGHPMQGAVTSYIEIQNDPHDRYLRLSANPAYWKSRFKGFLWNTVYSTDEKIGFLGETGLGSEGGYTYVAGCHVPCPSYKPGGKYTNNTGWVKFITTPVVGTLWLLGEDFLDRYVGGPVREWRPYSLWPKILRGGLNPCRTMANGMRFKDPWYRDFQHEQEDDLHGIHFLNENREAVQALPRFELAPHLNLLSLPVNNAQCTACRQETIGAGFGLAYRASRWVDFDADVDHQQNASPLPSYRAGGDVAMGTFGLRTGLETPNYAVKVSLRPGFVSYDRAWFIPQYAYTIGVKGPPAYPTAPMTPLREGRITHFATVLAVNADYGLSRHLALRTALNNTAIRYKETYLDRTPGRGAPPFLFFISPNVFATNENWGWQTGPVLRF